ncbi:unnamed protein product [Periconia digitata]|uniref:Heterokaryon incompatibility domain-containing protein n=1 Tax=Periconia digitata TaxID=1303443 RepID=A0A9W4U3K5_9PLEO|nr:unnamed protein product [Periconia digitata]
MSGPHDPSTRTSAHPIPEDATTKLLYSLPPIVYGKYVPKFWKNWRNLYRQKFKPLCTRCRDIDWPTMFQLSKSGPYSPQEVLGIRKEWAGQQFNCYLCQWLHDTGSSWPRIVATSMSRLFFSDTVSEAEITRNPMFASATVLCQNPFFTLNAIGAIRPDDDRERYRPRIIDRRSVDYDLIRRWIHNCSDLHHTEQCIAAKMEIIPGFKLIHCSTRKIVPAPSNCVYVALSYVWGEQQSEKLAAHTKFPRVVKDSIKVCLALGYEYLWVDRYCIDQENRDEKHSQMTRMDQIYSAASLTIIASDSGDPQHGLPGVGKTPRAHQNYVKTGELTLVNMYVNNISYLKNSNWGLRAWTYQEGLLSKRKLIFGLRQVHFVCGESHFAETFTDEIPLRILSDEYYFIDMFSTPKGNSPNDNSVARAVFCLNEYTCRKMSFESDSLNACLGVLRSLIKNPIVGHLWGVLTIDECDPYPLLSWYHPQAGHRRIDFPSWSWAGWEGEIIHNYTDALQPSLKGLHVDLCWEDGRVMTCKEYHNSGLLVSQAGSPEAPRLIQLTGCCAEFRIISKSTPVVGANILPHLWVGPFPEVYALCAVGTNLYRVYGVCLDYDISAEDLNTCIAMVVYSSGVSNLLLKPVGNRFQRVGLMTVLHYSVSEVDDLCHEDGEMLKAEEREYLSKFDLLESWFRNATKRTVIVE